MPKKPTAGEQLAAWRDSARPQGIVLTSTDTVPGARIVEVLGVVRGNTVRAKHLGKDILAGLKGMVGGEIRQYTELLTDARDEAYNRMVADATRLGADAVVNIRFVTSMIAQTMSELLAYGTAVKLQWEEGGQDERDRRTSAQEQGREVIDELTKDNPGKGST